MKKQGFLKGSAILLGMVFITKAVGLAYKIPLTHMLGGSGMAYYSGAFAVFTPLLAAVVSGICASTARLTAESLAFGRYAQLRKIKRCALLAYTAEGLLAAVLFTALATPLSVSFLHDENAVWTLRALAPSIVFSAVLSAERGYYEGLRNMLPTASSEIAETLIKAVLGLAGAFFVLDRAEKDFLATHGCFGRFFRTAEEARAAALPYAAAAAILAGSLATGCACIYIAVSGRRKGDGITPKLLARDPLTDSSKEIIRRLFAFSLPIAGAAVITTLTGTIDLVTVSRGLKTALAAGMRVETSVSGEALPDFMYGSYTGLALMVTGLVPTFTAMFGKSALPALTEAWSKGRKEELSRQIGRLLKLTALTALPCGMLTAAMPKQVLSFLFRGRTDEITAAAPALGILGAACIFTSFALPCLTALQTVGCRAVPILLMLGGAGIKLAGNLLLIPLPSLGLRGAALSTLAAQGFIAVGAVFVLIRRTEARISVSGTVTAPAFAALLGTVTALLTWDIPARAGIVHPESRILFAAAVCAGGCVYLSALWMLDILPKERLTAYFFKKFRKTY